MFILSARAIRRAVLGFTLLAWVAGMASCNSDNKPAIRIGVIHSLSGTMALSEAPLVDAVRLAVEEINQEGGLLGRTVKILVADGRSDPKVAAKEAERLIVQEGVSVLFGCWTSACRKALKPVVEKYQNLLFYPVQYEGFEQSPNIIYTGAAPNQQIVPGAYWAMHHLGKRVYLIGSDYIFPRLANRILVDLIKASDAKLLAERYLPLDAGDFTEIAQEIRRLHPDVVFNTVNGDSNKNLFKALRDVGLQEQAIMSFNVSEPEMRAMPELCLPNHYAVWGYFQNVGGEENRRFVAAYLGRFGADRATSDPIEAAYIGVKLWAQAVREAGSERSEQVNHTVRRQSIEAPSGILAVDPATRHLWKNVKIGRSNSACGFDIIYGSKGPLRPTPFPLYRSRSAWLAILADMEDGP